MTLRLNEHSSQGLLSERGWQRADATFSVEATGMLSEAPPARREYRLVFPGGKIAIDAPSSVPSWTDRILGALQDLLLLEPDWDTYGGSSIDPACVVASLCWAIEILHDNTPAPSVVPTSRGGVQFEWHVADIDLEIEFLSSVRVVGLFEDLTSGDAWEKDISYDWSPAVEAISRLSTGQC